MEPETQKKKGGRPAKTEDTATTRAADPIPAPKESAVYLRATRFEIVDPFTRLKYTMHSVTKTPVISAWLASQIRAGFLERAEP